MWLLEQEVQVTVSQKQPGIFTHYGVYSLGTILGLINIQSGHFCGWKYLIMTVVRSESRDLWKLTERQQVTTAQHNSGAQKGFSEQTAHQRLSGSAEKSTVLPGTV